MKVYFNNSEVVYVWVDFLSYEFDEEGFGIHKELDFIDSAEIKHDFEKHPESVSDLKGAESIVFRMEENFLVFQIIDTDNINHINTTPMNDILLTRYIPISRINEIKITKKEPEYKEKDKYSEDELENGK